MGCQWKVNGSSTDGQWKVCGMSTEGQWKADRRPMEGRWKAVEGRGRFEREDDCLRGSRRRTRGRWPPAWPRPPVEMNRSWNVMKGQGRPSGGDREAIGRRSGGDQRQCQRHLEGSRGGGKRRRYADERARGERFREAWPDRGEGGSLAVEDVLQAALAPEERLRRNPKASEAIRGRRGGSKKV